MVGRVDVANEEKWKNVESTSQDHYNKLRGNEPDPRLCKPRRQGKTERRRRTSVNDRKVRRVKRLKVRIQWFRKDQSEKRFWGEASGTGPLWEGVVAQLEKGGTDVRIGVEILTAATGAQSTQQPEVCLEV